MPDLSIVSKTPGQHTKMVQLDASNPTVSSMHSHQLPPELLALVLSRLELSERLCTMARVCSLWRTAAVSATNSISIHGSKQRREGVGCGQLAALSSWLHAHAAAAAALDTLAVTGCSAKDPLTLQLPMHQLTSLRSLDLERLTVATTQDTAAADPQVATATCCDLPRELSGITRLRLWDCTVWLGTLPAFTNLQHLALSSTTARGSGPDLSPLLHLTHLHLSGADGPVLGSLHSLTRLQELEIVSYPAGGLTALPVSLTKLCLRAAWCTVNIQGDAVGVDGDSIPAIAALTELRWLEMDGADGFSPAVLRGMTGLQHLTVRESVLQAAPAGEGDQQQQQQQQDEEMEQGEQQQGDAAASSPAWNDPWEDVSEGEAGAGQGESEEEEEEEGPGVGLTSFNRLKQLQHLELSVALSPVAPTTVDAAALTASSQLTCLILDGPLVKQRHYGHMFPKGRLLPKLKGLQATMSLLGTGRGASAVVRCCPDLEWLDVSAARPNEPVFQVYKPWDDWCSIARLCELQSLTRLHLSAGGEECTDNFWCGLARLTRLHDLCVNDMDMSYFGGIVQLTSCQHLTCLRTHWEEEDDEYEIALQTPQGQLPDVWRKLPQWALKWAVDHYSEAQSRGHDVQGAFNSLTRAAAGHSLQTERDNEQLRQEVQELRGTVADLGSKLQQEQEDRKQLLLQQERQQQQVTELQATMAAMGAQLQALVRQSSMQ